MRHRFLGNVSSALLSLGKPGETGQLLSLRRLKGKLSPDSSDYKEAKALRMSVSANEATVRTYRREMNAAVSAAVAADDRDRLDTVRLLLRDAGLRGGHHHGETRAESRVTACHGLMPKRKVLE